MTPSRAIAAAIVAGLQAQSWAADLTIVRAYRADWELKNFDGTKITIIAPDETTERVTRANLDSEWTIIVLMQCKLGIDPNADPAERNLAELRAVDPLRDLFQTISGYLFDTKEFGPGRWMGERCVPIVDKDLHLESMYVAQRAITFKTYGDSPWPLDNLLVSGPDGEEFLEVSGPDGLEYLEVSP